MILEDIQIHDSVMQEKNALSVHIAISLLPHQNSTRHNSKQLSIGSGNHIERTYDIHEIGLKAPNLLETLDLLIKEHRNESQSKARLEDEYLQKINSIIHDNLGNAQFSVGILSNTLGTSSSQLYRRMLEITGKPILKHIISYRLSKALELIKLGTYSIKEIAYKVGYNDNHYFSRTFKKEFGQAPSFYRPKANIT